MKLNLFDSHTHSDNSPDGNHSVTYLCERAIEKNVMGFAVTDHFECDMAEEDHFETRLRQSVFEIEMAKSTFGSAVRLTKGIELAQGHLFPDAAERALSITDYDFVLGSIHSLEKGKDLYFMDFNDPSIIISQVLEQYYRVQYDMAQWNRFDALAHLGYPERYIWGKYRIPVSLDPYQDYIDETLRTLIQNGKGLEVNTSGLRSGLGKTVPDREILRRYRELGGEIITIGSDAHLAEDIASGFSMAMDLLLELGYRYFAFYSQRKPVMLRIL